MARHKNAQQALNDLADQIQQGMDDKNIDLNIYSGRERMEICNNFAILFYQSLLQIIDDFNLTKTEIKAILKILDYMQWGNLVRMSYAQLARDIGADVTNSSKIIKKLKKANLLIDIDGNTFLNPHIIAKGRFKRKDENAMKVLDYSADILMSNTDLQPSILTKHIKGRLKTKEIIDEAKAIKD